MLKKKISLQLFQVQRLQQNNKSTQHLDSEKQTEKPTKIVSTRLDYFRHILGVTNGATSDDIKMAYNKIVQEYKSDENKNTEKEEKMKKIEEAYKTLTPYKF